MYAIARSAVLAALLLTGAGAAVAATVYRWTDDRGVIHFADVPPPGVDAYSAERLPDAAPPPPRATVPAETEAEGPGRAPRGPARVVITEREEVPLGVAAQAFRGEVTNEGGIDARDVAVAIRVTEPTQGEVCIDGRIRVEPATLAPGARGRFAADFDSPCFHGPTQAELIAEWD